MDKKQTHSLNLEQTMVAYLCRCGAEFSVSVRIGGTCPNCAKPVSGNALKNEHLSATTTMSTLPHGSLGITKDDDEFTLTTDKNFIGQSLGHFEIISPLGKGGQGYVYRALDKSLQRYVAVKVLQQSSTPQEVDLLLQEAVSQARVSHPNIVTIYYVGKEQEEPFLAMELITGQAVSDLIAQGDIEFSTTVQTASQLARALQFSYNLDIIHGDIKPSNVMILEDGTVKLSDFGMARRVSENESTVAGGTPNFLAPELLGGQSPSLQSDMYAMGVMLYEMTFGKLPVVLSGRSTEHWLKIHRDTEVTFPSPWPAHVPERWQEVLSKLLAKDPADRYENYLELESDLELVSPNKSHLARRVPRLIAAAIDLLTVFLFMIPLQLLISGEIGGVTISLSSFLDDRPLVTFLLYVLNIVPIAIYTAIVFFWRHSIGRALMQIRVVNRYGLKPYRSRMAFRSILRMSLAWMTVAGFWTRGLTDEIEFNLFALPTLALLGIFIANVVFLMFSRKTQSLHDRFFSTSVVIDTGE